MIEFLFLGESQGAWKKYPQVRNKVLRYSTLYSNNKIIKKTVLTGTIFEKCKN